MLLSRIVDADKWWLLLVRGEARLHLSLHFQPPRIMAHGFVGADARLDPLLTPPAGDASTWFSALAGELDRLARRGHRGPDAARDDGKNIV